VYLLSNFATIVHAYIKKVSSNGPESEETLEEKRKRGWLSMDRNY
jgi:hypothetical protein